MKKLILAMAALAFGFAFAQTKGASQKNLGVTNVDISKLRNATQDRNAPVVYFSREITPASTSNCTRRLEGNSRAK